MRNPTDRTHALCFLSIGTRDQAPSAHPVMPLGMTHIRPLSNFKRFDPDRVFYPMILIQHSFLTLLEI